MKTKCPINEEMVKGVVEDASDDEKVEGENENEGAIINFSLRVLKSIMHSSSNLKGTSIFIKLLRGLAILN